MKMYQYENIDFYESLDWRDVFSDDGLEEHVIVCSVDFGTFYAEHTV